MASLTHRPNGHVWIQFVSKDKRRRTIRVGKRSKRAAQTLLLRVEDLIASQEPGMPVDPKLTQWVSEIDDDLYEKLAAVGLVEAREVTELAGFIDGYIAKRGDVKRSTQLVYGHTRRCLVEYFGAARPLRDISEGDAEDWRLWLKTNQKLADNTIRRRTGIAKQFFGAALKRKLIAENPFAELECAIRKVIDRQRFISVDDIMKVIDAAPDAEWRLIIALARFAGLRVPSEVVALKWSDIDLPNGRFRVTSPKTEHHDGKGERIVPIFPELRPYFEDLFAIAQPGTSCAADSRVITRYRSSTQNFGTMMTKIVRRAGLQPWPKLFHNLRASRQTELAEDFPVHVVCAWIGNSPAIADKHYLQVTEDHFQRAAADADNPKQKAKQYMHETTENDQKALPAAQTKTPVLQGFSETYALLRGLRLGDEGLETPPESPKKRRISSRPEAKGEAVTAIVDRLADLTFPEFEGLERILADAGLVLTPIETECVSR